MSPELKELIYFAVSHPNSNNWRIGETARALRLDSDAILDELDVLKMTYTITNRTIIHLENGSRIQFGYIDDPSRTISEWVDCLSPACFRSALPWRFCLR